MGKHVVCVVLDDETYAELVDMLQAFPEYRSVRGLIESMIKHNISNYRRLKAMVRKIIQSVI